eukprot:CAMPEP_0171700126 /NCGR_PEP_ID=MMETSP0991-20121206/10363_1 /TAXON_ID=483369 /ORGANISM="non described non described, Strain CCMP2098" /LENGTH=214 /DNA_ID=CAMNT_0012289315 /DNA_START=264 /DNA_END=908 /DNA_ORIENTATION=+
MIGELTKPFALPEEGQLMPVGRLDEQSEGLLLLTTDGHFSYAVTSSGVVEKEYYAELDGIIDDSALEYLAAGVQISRKRSASTLEATDCDHDGVNTGHIDVKSGNSTCNLAATVTHWARPRGVVRLAAPPPLPARRRRIRDSSVHGPTSWVAITLTEGKYRQVRKMTAAVGFPTLRLVRVRVGSIVLGSLLPGELRRVTPDEEHLTSNIYGLII